MLLALNWQNFKKSKSWDRIGGYVTKTSDSLRILKYPNPIVLWFWFFEIPKTNWFFDFHFLKILGIDNSFKKWPIGLGYPSRQIKQKFEVKGFYNINYVQL
jgi:hypothetical protein